MNYKQFKRLWWHWGQAREWLIKHGRTAAEADAMRTKIIAKKLGRPRSMSDWKNWNDDEVTKVKAAFMAVSHGGDLNAQIEAEENPQKQAGLAEAELRNLLEEIYPDTTAREDTAFKRDNIMKATIRRICKKPLEACSAHDLKKVIGEFKQQKARNEKKAAEAIAAAHAASEPVDQENPFG